MSSSSSSSSWSIETYCEQQQQILADWTTLPTTTQTFLEQLGLSSLHPFCTTFAANWEAYYVDGIPRQGPLTSVVHDNAWETAWTWYAAVVPPLAAMGELWLRLFASALAPLGIVFMLHQWLNNNTRHHKYLCWICLLTVAASVVLLTDTLYALEFGPHVGASSLTVSTLLTVLLMTRRSSSSTCTQSSMRILTLIGTAGLVGLAAWLIYDPDNHNHNYYLTFGDPIDHVQIDEGLYYNTQNDVVHKIVTRHWSKSSSSSAAAAASTTTAMPYEYPTSMATPWMPTGDARTGLPFLLHHVPTPPFIRVWLPVPNDHIDEEIQEVVALDISFPATGYDPTRPLYLVLHGLNGGSTEEYVRDFVNQQTSVAHNATVVIMVARGLMDLPVRGWDNFHGARWTDAHHAAVSLRAAQTDPSQTLVAVGYSMGAIILGNMMVKAGKDVAVDAAISISGGLDMRQQQYFSRAQRLWQPILAKELRKTFLLGKWGERVRQKLDHETFLYMLRATHITEIDESAVVHYNGFRDVVDYYQTMSALGDVPLEELTGEHATTIASHRHIQQLHKPFLVVHALDDPLITWRTVAANQGPMHPQNLTAHAGNGNLLVLLTRRGGHVGWPMGWVPQRHTWYWMNHVAASFGEAVHATKNENEVVSKSKAKTTANAANAATA
eukprot:scaffold3051_cov175-Amphora_coffeaeformis.AAC.9